MAKVIDRSKHLIEGTPMTKEQIIWFFENKVGIEHYKKRRSGATPRAEWDKYWEQWQASKGTYGGRRDWAYVSILLNNFPEFTPMNQEEYF